ncbi:hypothetical protein ACFVMC_03795 [Nocardia sp. NPDC127579]|uniref:hypothetical protein n=1 Tax=Nocardia sp. NPDC127579 TaxID=3345402 RepID=UPI003645D827
MGLDRPNAREQLELDLVREVVLARRRLDSMVLAALTLGAELMNHRREGSTATRTVQILAEYGLDQPAAEQDRRRQRQTDLMREVRADLLEVLRRCRQYRYDRGAVDDEIARGLCAATDKLVIGADMDTYQAWQRGMVLKLVEEPTPHGPPRVMATVDAGPGRGPLTVEWDTPERRLALVARLARAGIAPMVICDRLLADLSVSSPLRYSYR